MIEIKQGDTVTIEVALFVDNIEYKPSEAEIVEFAVKKNLSDPEALFTEPVSSGVVQLDHTDTKDLTCGLYNYDVRIYTADKSLVLTPIVGLVHICEVVNCGI